MKDKGITKPDEIYGLFGEEIKQTLDFKKFDFVQSMYILNVFVFNIVFFSIVFGLIYDVRKQMKRIMNDVVVIEVDGKPLK